LIELLRERKEKNQLRAALCASPAVVLAPHGLLEGAKAVTCHPSLQEKLPIELLARSGGDSSRVVVDGTLVTSQGPGTSLEFALELVRLLFGDEKANQVGKPMLVPGYN
jgi:4-methyl-5(b-hydroxyethyl)-thiazole monophosphate biosynthesis